MYKRQEYHLSEKKIKRWHQIIRAAAEQSEVRWLPLLHNPMPFQEVLKALKGCDLSLIASLYPDAKNMTSIDFKDLNSVSILIGLKGTLQKMK